STKGPIAVPKRKVKQLEALPEEPKPETKEESAS
ncbi:MAG: hypothetical protein RL696_595, partial [Actinomycetota bacterium]